MLNDMNVLRPSRRSLLSWGGVAALSAAGLGSGMSSAYAAGGIPASKLIRVEGNTGPAYFREKALHHGTVLQSIGFDNVNRRIYIAQLMQGGIRLAGESSALSGATRDLHGDLTVTQWDMSGNITGHMYLRGFGHGVSFGVEPSGTSTYLWFEVDAVQDRDKMTSRGRRICRFKFVNTNTPLDATSTSLQKFTPVAGSTTNTVSIDPVHNRLVHRYNLGGMRFAVHDLAKARAGDFGSPLVDIAQPAVKIDPQVYGKPSFQGYAVGGSYLYLLHGNSYDYYQDHDGNPDTPKINISRQGEGNTHLTSVNLNTGQIVKTFHSRAAHTLSFREPEGLAIQIPNPATPDVFRLCMGFASGLEPGKRLASIYYKDDLVQP